MKSWYCTIQFVMLRKDYSVHYSNPALSEEIYTMETKEIQPGMKW